MVEQLIHDQDPGFDRFIEDVLTQLSARAEQEGICIECLSDRMIVELVAGMVRSGVAVSAILAMVGEGVDAGSEAVASPGAQQNRVH